MCQTAVMITGCKVENSKFKVFLFVSSFHSFRNVFKVNDIALNYRDPEGDLIRILDDEDIELMIKASTGQKVKDKRPVNQFPWELHVTLSSDLTVYNTESWEHQNQDKLFSTDLTVTNQEPRQVTNLLNLMVIFYIHDMSF